MSAIPKHPTSPDVRGAHSLPRLVGRCRNCGGRKRARDRHRKYCEDCRISLKISKRNWVDCNRDARASFAHADPSVKRQTDRRNPAVRWSRLVRVVRRWEAEADLLRSGDHPRRQRVPACQVLQEEMALRGCIADIKHLRGYPNTSGERPR